MSLRCILRKLASTLPFWNTAGVLLRAIGYSHSRGVSILIGSSKWCLKIPFPRSFVGGEECDLLSLAFSSLLLENLGLEPAPLSVPLLGLLLPEWILPVIVSGFSF